MTFKENPLGFLPNDELDEQNEVGFQVLDDQSDEDSDHEGNEYMALPMDNAEEEDSCEENIFIEKEESQVSPETQRKNKASLEEFDHKYHKEMETINHSPNDFKLSGEKIDEIKEIMKGVKIDVPPNWTSIAQEKLIQSLEKKT